MILECISTLSHVQRRSPENTAFKGIAGAMASTIVGCKQNWAAPINGSPGLSCQGKRHNWPSRQNLLLPRSWNEGLQAGLGRANDE